MKHPIIILLTVITCLGGCISAPKQTVQLAEIVDRQISEMQSSHEQFVRLYYDKLRDDVERFMVDKWIPQFLANVVQGTGEQSKQFREDLDVAYKMASVDWENTVGIRNITDNDVQDAIRRALERLTNEEAATLGMVLLDFSQGAQTEINKQRATLIKPVDEQEAFVLEQLRDGYNDLLRGSATIKGYLASVVKIQEQRDAVFERIGALETQRRAIRKVAEVSDQAASILEKAKNAESSVDQFLDKFQTSKIELEKLFNKGD